MLRLSTSGKGFVSLRQYDGGMTVGGRGAIDVLLNNGEDTEAWLERSAWWAESARDEICKAVGESVGKILDPPDGMRERVDALDGTWRKRKVNGDPDEL